MTGALLILARYTSFSRRGTVDSNYKVEIVKIFLIK
jgi:hypothetical protein